ncbi:hypothetical protein C4D60_Mb02t21710 [Musa balbisiana]|uniref:Uncharacterized protein n=1 Tax=Musa balbisiana TaxID=52838 RepID=A0A4S8ICJ1_MUSBA|nr:hypothetical protein C4D60_Mb02t21710 [Musa balbisiana]
MMMRTDDQGIVPQHNQSTIKMGITLRSSCKQIPEDSTRHKFTGEASMETIAMMKTWEKVSCAHDEDYSFPAMSISSHRKPIPRQ